MRPSRKRPAPTGGEGDPGSLFRLLIEHTHDMVVVLDAEGVARFANPAHEAVLGYPPADLVGTRPFDLIHPEDLPGVVEAFRGMAGVAGWTTAIEFRIQHRLGGWRTVEAVGRNLLDHSGVNGVIVSSRDVTERRLAEARANLLLDIARDASGAVEAPAVLARILGRMARALPCAMAGAYLFDTERGVWHVGAHVGVPPEHAPTLDGLTFPPGKPFDGKVAGGTTIVVNAIAEQPWLPPEMCSLYGVGPFVAAPLRVGERHLGLLIFIRRPGDAGFAAGEVELCDGVTRQVATALAAIDVYREQREEAKVSRALARVGEELIASLNRGEFLGSLCRVTAEVLECEESYTLLWRPEEDAWTAIASHGAVETAEVLSHLRFPSSALAPVAEALGAVRPSASRGDAPADVARAHLDPLAAARSGPAPLRPGDGIAIALRRGGELIGIQFVRVPLAEGSFNNWQLRVGAGLAQVASLAIEHARLVRELEGALRLRTDFLATMSHELRTPLNVILGYSEMLLDAGADLSPGAPEGSAAPTGLVRRIDRSARELLDLIESTLDMSRLEAGRMEVVSRPIRLTDLLREIAAEVRAGWHKSEVRFEVRVPPQLPVLWTDARKLKIVVKNLLGNAVKFTDRGEVSLEAKAESDHLEIAVADTGIGIESEALQQIFAAFYQTDAAQGRNGGVGLGLYIVKSLVGLLGGEITVESRTGLGSRFEITLPLA
jgi:PAS domain S-box-containing protein